jgi:hypothetical protein
VTDPGRPTVDDRAIRRRDPLYRVLLRSRRPSEVFRETTTQGHGAPEAQPVEVPQPRQPE